MDERIAQMLEARSKVFCANPGELLRLEMNLRAVAYMLGDVLLPMCCLVCNLSHLEKLLAMTSLCRENGELRGKLAKLIYDYLARCKGL